MIIKEFFDDTNLDSMEVHVLSDGTYEFVIEGEDEIGYDLVRIGFTLNEQEVDELAERLLISLTNGEAWE